MVAINTPNLQLAKPDPNDLVNVLTDLDANYDKIDAAVGIQGTGGRGCEYNDTQAGTIPIGNDFQLGYNVERRPSSLIVPSGTPNKTFTVQATGWYDLGVGVAQGDSRTVGLYLYINVGATLPGQILPVAGTGNAPRAFPILSVQRSVYLTSGQALCAGLSVDTNPYIVDTTRRNYFTAYYKGL